MQSPPKAFGTPRRNKRHKSNNYNPYVPHEMDNYTTDNPNINYLSPPRKHKKRNNYYSAPQRSRHNNIHSSPISTRYQTRIGTSLYDNDNTNTNNNISPLRNDKYLSSPISPTFKPIGQSPNKKYRNRNGYNNNNKIDRYTPTKGNINQYEFHSPTKRFLHNNKNMVNYTNIIRPTPAKKRKLTQNYSGTNDDPNSLNHKIKQRLSQHTYNMVLQSELLGHSQQYHLHNCNETHIENDNISSIQNEPNDQDEKENNTNIQQNIYSSPSLPNRRIPNQCTPNRDVNKNKNMTSSHHPLCPCYNINTDDNSINDSEDSEQHNHTNNNNNNNFACVCDSITANVASDFLASPQRTLRYNINENDRENNENNDYNLNMTPIKQSSQSQLNCSRKSMRNIAKSPFKVLDAPRLTDDFYLNLVDWSQCSNILSVGLGECVYLWSAYTSKVTKLVDLTQLFNDSPPSDNFEEYGDGYDMVCSVGWNKNITIQSNDINDNKNISCNYLAIGSGNGYVFVFDTNKSKLLRKPLNKHNHRVGVIAWKNKNILATGSRDRNIFLRDIRISDQNDPGDITSKLSFHKQEVCGLKWSHDSLYLASGGNDNKLAIWDLRYINNNKPLCYGKHKAAVKAITWSPHESGLIASGGGTADRCIKFWNINSFIASSSGRSDSNNNKHINLLKPSEVIDTGSQVCNLLWSKNVNEIVSTHGYSLNQIVVWKYPTMDKIVTLTGHTYRVLYLAGSPDGQTIVTGAGDETLRLWNIFPPLSNNGNDINTFVPQPYSIPLHIR